MKKKCFICNCPLGFTNANCITKDGYLVCATDSKRICPDNHANNFSISLKTSKFINSHSASEILQILGMQPSTSYKDNPDQYRSKLYKTTDKLNKAAEKMDAMSNEIQKGLDEANKEQEKKTEIIKQQLANAEVTDVFGTKKEIKSLPDIIDIDNGETILYAAGGFVDSNSVLIVCTNTRIIFLDRGLIYGTKTTEIPLDMVNGVSYSKGLVLGSIAVTNGAVTTQIENLQKYSAQKLADTIKNAAANFKQNQQSYQANNGSDLSQLRELKQLLDDGIITKEEFTTKKKQILGI